jgi:hypothetical protein
LKTDRWRSFCFQQKRRSCVLYCMSDILLRRGGELAIYTQTAVLMSLSAGSRFRLAAHFRFEGGFKFREY